MTLLHFDLPGSGAVLGHEFVDHLLDAPEEIVADLLTNPLWRHATDADHAEWAERLAEQAPADSDASETPPSEGDASEAPPAEDASTDEAPAEDAPAEQAAEPETPPATPGKTGKK